MKRRNWMIFAAGALMMASGAFAADQVKMATSEDLSAFDAQLGAGAPAQVRPAPAKNGLGSIVSEEAKKMKEAAPSAPFGQQVKARANQNGLGLGRASSVSGGGQGVGLENKAVGKKNKK
ncbi:MAG: hypothetical protein NDJ90_01925 [Oligoflexia bacterium]|nr:hypothetical protein [Oligoflexia bacterium]